VMIPVKTIVLVNLVVCIFGVDFRNGGCC